MLALSIRQPYVELILRGMKTVEFRSRATRVVGKRFYLYAARPKTRDERLDARAIAALGPDGKPPARTAAKTPAVTPASPAKTLPDGVIVGTAVVTAVTGSAGHYQWHLGNVKRLRRPRKPTRHPQPVWFSPF